MFDGCISKTVNEHFPFNWSKLATKFLQFPHHRVPAVVTGKRVNQGAGFGLGIHIDVIFTEALEKQIGFRKL